MKRKVPAEIWNEYLKFSIIRNPWARRCGNDRAVTTSHSLAERSEHMRIVVLRLVAAALLVSSILVPSSALAGYRENMSVTSVEIAQLPQFCWAQFEVPDAQGDEFKIRDCGVGVNHYCPGLITLIRGKGSAARGKPLPLIRMADAQVAYTEKGISGYPNCPIRGHVEATRAEINRLLRMYGSKPATVK